MDQRQSPPSSSRLRYSLLYTGGCTKTLDGVQPCRENKLSGMVKSMCVMVGVSGKTNHSLRATGASSLFQAGAYQKKFKSVLVTAQSKRFECTSVLQISNILSSPTEVNLPQSTVHGSCAKPVADAGVSFTTMFASASNCVININMATPVYSWFRSSEHCRLRTHLLLC